MPFSRRKVFAETEWSMSPRRRSFVGRFARGAKSSRKEDVSFGGGVAGEDSDDWKVD